MGRTAHAERGRGGDPGRVFTVSLVLLVLSLLLLSAMFAALLAGLPTRSRD